VGPRYAPGVPPGDPDPIDPLELLRAASGLSIDGEGRLLHRGEPITHARTLEVLWRSLARDAAGRWTVRIGRETGYVAVEDTPWVVLAVHGLPEAGPLPRAPALLLSDRTREPLRPETLHAGADGVLRCGVKEGEPARFSRAAHLALGAHLDDDPSGTGRYTLTVGGVVHPVPRR
jgi:hypothetical protein